jgi:hypothetical protein
MKSGPGSQNSYTIMNPVVNTNYGIYFSNDPLTEYTISWTPAVNPGDWPGDTNLMINGKELDMIGAVSAGGAGIGGTDCAGNHYQVNICDGGYAGSPNKDYTYTCAVNGLPDC